MVGPEIVGNVAFQKKVSNALTCVIWSMFSHSNYAGNKCTFECVSKMYYHYENTPVQIYRKFHLRKTENFLIKKKTKQKKKKN